MGAWIILGVVVAFGLLLAGALEMGARRPRTQDEDSGSGAIGGTVFATLGLLFAFTFGIATNRFEARRTLVVNEANAVGTALLRSDLLPEPARTEMRGYFADLVDLRLAYGLSLAEGGSPGEDYRATQEVQARIWQLAVSEGAEAQRNDIVVSLLPALNEMFDLAAERHIAAATHLPPTVYAVLVALSLLGAFLAGRGLADRARRQWLHRLAFILSFAFSLGLVLDLDHPRLGFVRIDHADAAFRDLQAELGQP